VAPDRQRQALWVSPPRPRPDDRADVAGAGRDRRAIGRRKPWIAGFGVLLVIGSAFMWIGRPGGSRRDSAAAAGYAIASVGVEFATVFTMDDAALVPPDKIGRCPAPAGPPVISAASSADPRARFLAANPDTGRTLFGFSPHSVL